jgi:1-acyl-sn-glycerol-3-phosphate acyltransferase
MLSSLIFIITMIVTGIPTALLFIPWCWLSGNVLPLYKGTRFMLSSSCRLAGVRFNTTGLENVPRDRACIFMSNHVSNLDPPALISLIPGRTSAFMKRSLMELPVLGTGFRMGEFIAVDRSGNAAAAKESVAAAEHVLAKVVHITTFVEGTRSTAACCHSRKARSSWPWAPVRRAFRSPSMAPKRYCAKAACACTLESRT